MDSNLEALALFSRSLTQFRHGFNGPTGMIYSEVKLLAKILNIPFAENMSKLQVMEWEYLAIVAESSQKESDKHV